MAEPIRACDAHGYFEGETCPRCEHSGAEILDGERRERLSRFVSGALRHFPDDVGIALDDSGWTSMADLVAAVEQQYDWADERSLRAVIDTDPKGRFERERERVRAAYGHSVDVDLGEGAEGDDIPDTLFHGTAQRHLDSIEDEGLVPMDRQAVHLSGTVEEARAVGERHAEDPVVLAIDARGLEENGFDVTKRGSGVYTVSRVPPEHLRGYET
ncbi:MAG: RNA 2'-phosphotransferase [Halodesulfurarchaeum sp.]